MYEFKIGSKRLPLPLIQGGMGVGISMSGLAGSVAARGGIGTISAAQPGFREPDFAAEPLAANLRVLRREIRRARELAVGQGMIAVNIMCAAKNYEALVRCSVEAGADIIVSGAGLPIDLPRYVAEGSCLLGVIVSPPKSAELILQYWERHYHRLPDLMIIEGPGAGGHLGYSTEEVEAYEQALLSEPYPCDEQIRRIQAICKGYAERFGRRLPLAFGGGICTAEDTAHYLGLGLDAVQVASRFITTQECDAHPAYKQFYLGLSREDMQLVKSPVGLPGRAARNAFLKALENGRRPVEHCYQCLKKCQPASIPYCISRALMNAAEGRIADALMFGGINAWRSTRIESVAEVLRSLLPDFLPASQRPGLA